MTSAMKVVGYVRVSTDEQAESGAGLTAQRQAIQRAAEDRAWDLVAIYEDAGFSGKAVNRPGLAQALAAVECGKAEALVVAKLDRLSRSMKDFTALLDRALRKGWSVVVPGMIDTTTPEGEMMAHVVGTFAQYERRLIGQRTKNALAVKRSQGVRLGRPRQLDARVRRRIVRLHSAGHSYRGIAARLNDDGTPTAQGGVCWYPATVRQIVLAHKPSARLAKGVS